VADRSRRSHSISIFTFVILDAQGPRSGFNFVDPYEGDTEGSSDAFVSKLTPAGNALTWSTSLGGNGTDIGNAIAIGADGENVYVVGETPKFVRKSGEFVALRSAGDGLSASRLPGDLSVIGFPACDRCCAGATRLPLS